MDAVDDLLGPHPRRLTAGERTLVRRAIAERGERRAAKWLGVTRVTMFRALAGMGVAPETATRMREAMGIEARAAIEAVLREVREGGA